jgi:hypothetical protein
MTAANPVIKGDPRSREAAILSAVYEAVSWRHSIENAIEGPRNGQRVVFYPQEITGLSQVLTSRNVTVDDDLEDNSELYEAILNESDQFECPPLFMREDCDELTSHPVWALKIGQWMITAARVATGSRPRVLEDGPDVMNSDDEDSKKDEHGEELTGMYANGCSTLEEARMTEQQAQVQRASVTFSSSLALPKSTSPTGEDWSWMSEKQRKLAEAAVQLMALSSPPPRPATRIPEPEFQAPAKAGPLEITKAILAPAVDIPESFTKAVASPRAPADQPTGTKVPPRKKGRAKGQESPGTKVPPPTVDRPPMATRSSTKKQPSGAGGLGGVTGSGQIGAVCGSSSPARKPGS